MPILTAQPLGNHPRMTGAHKTPFHRIAAAMASGRLKAFQPQAHLMAAAPTQVAMVPPKLNMEGNDQYGDCVTAEEAASISAYTTYLGLPEATVSAQLAIAWARKYGFLDGADLLSVIQQMESSGMTNDQGFLCKDGTPSTVDYSTESVLQAALAVGPVKIGIDSTALPSGAGSQQGWAAFGGSPGQYNSEDHCVALWGYGPTTWLCQQLDVPLPTRAPAAGYLLYTWSTIGIVDHAWIMSTTGEAYLRTPTTQGLTPTPPPPPPPPPPGPTPVGNVLTLATGLSAGTYQVGAPSPVGPMALIEQGINDLLAGNANGWTELSQGVSQLLNLTVKSPGMAPWVLQIINALVQFLGTQGGIPQAWIDAIEALIAQFFGASAAASFRQLHANIRRIA